MDAAREAERGFRGEVVLPGRATNIDEVPGRALEQDIACMLGHLRFSAAHDACNGERPFLITYQNVRRGERTLHAIESCELLTVFGAAGDNANFPASGTLLQYIVVEGVERLTQLEHGVVRSVHNRVDRAHARQLEPPLDLIGARLDLDLPDETRDE